MGRLKRILKWTAIAAAAAITVLLLINAFFVMRTGTRLASRLEDLRRAGEPVQLADLAHDPLEPDKNAETYLRRGAGDVDAIEKELGALYPKRGVPTETLTTVEQEKLAKLFAAFPNVIPTLETAADCPDSDPQLDCTLPPSQFLQPFMDHTTKHRVIARVLRARSALLVATGHRDEALATQILSLRLSRQRRREPFLMGFLVTAASEQIAVDEINQILQAGPVSAHSRESLDRELALHDTMEGHNWALKSERAFALSSAWEMPGAGFWLTRGFVNDLALQLIALFDRHLERGAQPFAAVKSPMTKPRSSGTRLNPLATLASLLEPALNSAREAAERTRAVSRALRVLNALQARGPAARDREPKVGELDLPAQATVDPFSGEPLLMKRLPEGWMVYSVGSNLIDDGGDLNQRADVGVGPIARDVSKK